MGIIIFIAIIFLNKFGLVKTDYRNISIGAREFSIEIARTNEARKKGLGGRDYLCVECGMLFEFNKPGRYSFWMKDMKFSLDIIWILGSKIVHIENNVPPDFQEVISPPVFADRVLELSSGAAVGAGLKIGDKISLK